MSEHLEKILPHLKNRLATPHQVAILGSTSFYDSFTPKICDHLGEKLAKWRGLSLLTGGVSGVPDGVASALWRSPKTHKQSYIYHFQASSQMPLDYGIHITAGRDMTERRWLLAHLARIYVVISGGPGTEQEARWAIANGAIVIPVGITKGIAKNLYQELSQSQQMWLWRSPETMKAWQALDDFQLGENEIADAICTLVKRSLQYLAQRTRRKNILKQSAANKTDFSNYWFYKTDLSGIDFGQANLQNAVFQSANLDNSSLKDTNTQGALFQDTDINQSQIAPQYWQSNLVTQSCKTVFIIDDSITVRELLKITFENAGYNVILARDGQDAWETLHKTNVDFIWCDIEMPRIDGIDLYLRIQKDEQLKKIPFAFITSRGASGWSQPWSHVPRFTKPYVEDRLLAHVAEALKS